MECIFCELHAQGVKPLFSTQHFDVRLDVHPVSPGHLLIIPRRHVMSLDDLEQGQEDDLNRARRLAVRRINSADKAVWRRRYEEMRAAKFTHNSPWFIDQALAHPRFGTKPDGYNHGVNEGRAAGQTVKHLHWHVIPRYEGDMSDPRGGVRYVIPELGNYTDPR